jgi:transposase InsO family protein
MLTRHSIHEYAASVRQRYQRGKKAEKGKILDEFCATTGLHRKAVIRLLRTGSHARAVRRGRPRRYGPEVLEALRLVWETGDRMCGKLLVAVMPDIVAALERHGELKLPPAVRELLLRMSASTIDRLLRKQSLRLSNLKPKHKAAAQPSLKAEVPVKTWSEWQGVKPGSLQADLVHHCGGSEEGFFLTTLTAVDVATGWLELQPITGHGKTRVGSGMHLIRRRLPFTLQALHTDNGSEFINDLLIPWCRQEKISFSRGRPYRKNDQAYVEQRNWQNVRRHVGYERYSSQAAYELLLKLYPLLSLQANFLRPVRKLASKERQGAKVRKRYDEPQTPYQRLRTSGALSETGQAEVEKHLLALNPADLQRRIDKLLRQLWLLTDRPTGQTLVRVG